MIDYKYNEGQLIEEFKKYIDSTYGEHYSKDKFQATEFIIDGGHGTGFCLGNVMKYTQRYGKKGTTEDWRKDIMKVLHYALIQLHVHDKQYAKPRTTTPEEWVEVYKDLVPSSGTYTVAPEQNLNVDLDTMTFTLDVSVPDDIIIDSSLTPCPTRISIDDATPEEWNETNKKLKK